MILNRITELRMKMDISEKRMSRDIGKASTYLSTMNANKSLPSLRTLIDICNYLNITLNEFFDKDYKNPMLIEEILDELKKCSDNQLEIILKLTKEINRKD